MEFWEENKKVIVGCGTALLVLLAVYLFFLGPMWRRVEALAEENEKMAKELATYYPEGGVTVENLKGTFEELRYLKKSIGRTGLLAIDPFLHTSTRDLWQLNMLNEM